MARKKYTEPVYTDNKVLNKTIDNINKIEVSTDYILDHYFKVYGKAPTLKQLMDERDRMKKWLFKDETFLNNLKTAIGNLNKITLPVYLEDYLETRRVL